MIDKRIKRREFIKKTGMFGLGFASAGTGFASCVNKEKKTNNENDYKYAQIFNMSGFAASKLEVVRIGIIGIGNRGSGTVKRLACIEGVEIKALCDLEHDRIKKSAEGIRHLGHYPDLYSGGENDWKKVCERSDIDLIAIVTPWHLHAEMCVFAMEHDKHAYTELPVATTIEDCWKLVETSERTRKHCVQMSASSDSGIDAVILNMSREGYFGELIHAEGCYIHDLLLSYNFSKEMYHNMWRLKENIGKHGNLYPQHGLVPIMQLLDINYGDKMDFLTSTSSNDFMMGKTAESLAEDDDFWKQYVGKNYRGNMNVTVIRTVKGRTIVLQHDVTSPRPRGGYLLSGTKGIFQAVYNEHNPYLIANNHTNWFSQEEFNNLVEKYTPEITKRFKELMYQAEKIESGGHSYFRTSVTDWRLIDCLRNGLPLDMDVYDAATSSSIIPLSIWSVANRSNSIDIPDFTSGKWETNQRGMDINLLRGGGNTKLL